MTSRVSIAIIGAGLAGATLANALSRNERVDVQVYESALEFSEPRDIIELSHLSLKALEGIIPSVVEALKAKAGASVMDEAHVVLGSGPKIGVPIRDLGIRGMVMDRPLLHQTLLSPLAKENFHAGRKLISVEQTASGVVKLEFENGEIAECDAVIGADGTFSRVRDYILQQDAKTHAAHPAGWWECITSVPFEAAKTALKNEAVDMVRGYQWMGDGVYMMHAPSEDRTHVLCVAVLMEKGTPLKRKLIVTKDDLKNRLDANQLKLPAAKAVAKLMLNSDSLEAYSHWEHKSTPSYSRSRVCVVGDAAHTTSLWQGAGGAMALEDAFILGTLLRGVESANDVDDIFKTFDTVRRPRCQRIIDTSRETGRLCCRANAEANAEQLGDMLSDLSTHIGALDLGAHMRDAFDELHKLKQFQLQ